MASRRTKWSGYSVEGHLGLLDDDVDLLEERHTKEYNDLNTKLDNLRQVLIGVLVALTTASLIGAANLVLR